MSTHASRARVARISALPACLAAALGLTSFHAISGPNRALLTRERPPQTMPGGSAAMDPMLPAYLRLAAARAEAGTPHHPNTGMDHLVTSCFDNGVPGTLRYEITNAASGDSINLTQLACSKITLGGIVGTEINVTQDELHIHGPGADQLTIDGDFGSRVFNHTGMGTLGITGVTIANGYYIGGPVPRGGCIYSSGNLLLLDSVVSNCTIQNSDVHPALGGAVYTYGYTALFHSTVSDSRAYTATSSAPASGGGVLSEAGFNALYSTVSGNFAAPILGSTAYGFGGGIWSVGSIDIESSTISGNEAEILGGVDLFGAPGDTAKIVNSTISGNNGRITGGGIYADIPLTLANSTIAFNTTDNITVLGDSYAGGLYTHNAPLTLDSSIIADNKGPNGQDDLNGTPGTTVMGANNLVTSWNLVNVNLPANALASTSCPKLDPLANNGGSTLTHKLRHDSPAIDRGDPGTLQFDQRGAERVYGTAADIGAVEWQPPDQDERILASGFDGVCDW